MAKPMLFRSVAVDEGGHADDVDALEPEADRARPARPMPVLRTQDPDQDQVVVPRDAADCDLACHALLLQVAS